MRYGQQLQKITASVDSTMTLEEVASVVVSGTTDTRAYWMIALTTVAVTATSTYG